MIKSIIKGRDLIYVPGYPCLEDIKICTYLGCYLFSADPLKSKQLCSKYEQRKLFTSTDLPVLPSISEFIEIGELSRAFSEIIIKNPQVQTWVFKINSSSNSQGLALYSLPKTITSILLKIQEQQRKDKSLNNTMWN